jgi:hypothetical protein
MYLHKKRVPSLSLSLFSFILLLNYLCFHWLMIVHHQPSHGAIWERILRISFFLSSRVCVCTQESENKRKWKPRTAAVTWSRNFTSSLLFYSLTYILRNSTSCSNIQDQFSFIRLGNNGWVKTTTTCLFT